MKGLLFSLFITICCLSCSEIEKSTNQVSTIEADTINTPPPQKRSTDYLDIRLKEDSTIAYAAVKAKIQSIRLGIDKAAIPKDSLSSLFTNLLLNDIIPYWYRTKWSFTGHTATPRVGEIACGYFVSTTLKDMGLNINRYKLAQQSPINEAKTISMNQDVVEVANETTNENIKALEQNLEEGLYFIGFDQSHVGYILKRKNQLFLLHSNYIDSKGVVIERIEDSKVFSFFNRFYISEISTNEALLEKWLSQREIKVVAD